MNKKDFVIYFTDGTDGFLCIKIYLKIFEKSVNLSAQSEHILLNKWEENYINVEDIYIEHLLDHQLRTSIPIISNLHRGFCV